MAKLIYRKDRDLEDLVRNYGFIYKSDNRRNRYIEQSNVRNNALVVIESSREVMIYDYSSYATIPLILFKLFDDDMLEWEK